MSHSLGFKPCITPLWVKTPALHGMPVPIVVASGSFMELSFQWAGIYWGPTVGQACDKHLTQSHCIAITLWAAYYCPHFAEEVTSLRDPPTLPRAVSLFDLCSHPNPTVFQPLERDKTEGWGWPSLPWILFKALSQTFSFLLKAGIVIPTIPRELEGEIVSNFPRVMSKPAASSSSSSHQTTWRSGGREWHFTCILFPKNEDIFLGQILDNQPSFQNLEKGFRIGRPHIPPTPPPATRICTQGPYLWTSSIRCCFN